MPSSKTDLTRAEYRKCEVMICERPSHSGEHSEDGTLHDLSEEKRGRVGNGKKVLVINEYVVKDLKSTESS